MKQGLGTQLRHLIELLDGAVAASYAEAGIDYRPRYTPVMRALAEGTPRTVGQIAAAAGITQPAATQTVALMLKEDLVATTAAPADARQKLVHLSERGRALLPRLQQCWAATSAAAASLDADLPYPLSTTLAQAIAALEQQSFGARIRAARHRLSQTGSLHGDKEIS
ncbi:MarR family winged helix-turn-helix transcriptional regulator [Pseudoduganella umbonata]|uniref:MarR family transcriptional regulator n=1 Tax=Pseudoduganella umbonata TaxID=864828 RepID=A0A4P8HTC3_9BURK|nr:MarR family transcriptional regulator [Pseudoduganella umbonata]MBB3220785.1 DNA-binding MarR family transcriptional regulator [Pseudoduganella umbonata]QCP11744.1 MarR family transcriptional regulator [Pseudoduganella umbonata]